MAAKRTGKKKGWVEIKQFTPQAAHIFPGPDRPCGQSPCQFMVRFTNEKGWFHVGSVKSDRHHYALPGDYAPVLEAKEDVHADAAT